MTKPELYQKHPELFEAKNAELMADLAHHMRGGAMIMGPQFPKNAVLDGIAVARKLAFMEGWLEACDFIQILHIKPAPPTQKQPNENYANPNPNPQQS